MTFNIWAFIPHRTTYQMTRHWLPSPLAPCTLLMPPLLLLLLLLLSKQG